MNAPQPTAIPEPRPVAMPLRLLGSWELIFRIVIAVVIALSLTVAWWSFAKVLPPLQRRARELHSTHAQVSTEVDKLAREWSVAKAREVANHYIEARSQLFSNESAFAQWLADLNGQTSTLTLDAK